MSCDFSTDVFHLTKVEKDQPEVRQGVEVFEACPTVLWVLARNGLDVRRVAFTC